MGLFLFEHFSSVRTEEKEGTKQKKIVGLDHLFTVRIFSTVLWIEWRAVSHVLHHRFKRDREHTNPQPTGSVFLVVMSLPVYDICASFCFQNSALVPHYHCWREIHSRVSFFFGTDSLIPVMLSTLNLTFCVCLGAEKVCFVCDLGYSPTSLSVFMVYFYVLFVFILYLL
jgi:hypothetical protein